MFWLRRVEEGGARGDDNTLLWAEEGVSWMRERGEPSGARGLRVTAVQGVSGEDGSVGGDAQTPPADGQSNPSSPCPRSLLTTSVSRLESFAGFLESLASRLSLQRCHGEVGSPKKTESSVDQS